MYIALKRWWFLFFSYTTDFLSYNQLHFIIISY